MPIDIPESANEVVSRSKADVQRELPGSNPNLKNNWIGAIVTGAANRIYDFYLQLSVALRDSLPDTAVGDMLVRWAAIWGKQKLAASKASGNVVATGTATSTIPSGTIMTSNGFEYSSTSAAVISAQTINISSLTRAGTTVTAVTASDHNLANGVSVAHAGAANAEYNITANITVTAANGYQYEITGTPPDEPATSATASFTTASVPVESTDFGVDVNQDAGVSFKLQSPIAGVDDTLIVDFNEISGGTDEETEDELRSRMLYRIQNPVAHFNVSAITEKAQEIAGVTRVFVQEVTPDVGQVTIYFMRDNDVDPIPVGSEVAKVLAKILEIKPANTQDADVIVSAPTGISVDFTFSALTPNTTTMQAAILANLRQFFDEETDVGVNISEDAYRSIIHNTVDTVTGDSVTSFALTIPSGAVTISTGEIGVLGTVTF